MKMRRDHRVPLSRQALAILKSGPLSDFVVSHGTLRAALRRMGVGAEEMSAHGWRSTFSTMANERQMARPEVIEAALAHVVAGVRGIYNRADYRHERVQLIQDWADYLDALRADKGGG